MKVGVITFHSAHNFGASLQTWALQKVLKKNSHEAGVIHYHPDVIDNLYNPIKSNDPKEIKKTVKKLNKTAGGRDRLLRYDKYTRFIREHFNLLGDYKTYDDLVNADLGLDAYITGSDQVWNDDHIGGYNPAYFLEFVPSNAIKMSYAASIGKNEIPMKYHSDVKHALESFDAISVREETAKNAIEPLTDKEVNVVLDPTLLLEKEDYEEIKEFPDPNEKYILVYMMEHNPDVIKFANKISKAVGLPIIQRRPKKYFVNEIKGCYTCTPGEFLGLVENAEYVITNSFHGTVFSLIYQKPFVSMLHSGTGSRTTDLLKVVGEESHLLNSITDFNDFRQFEIADKARLEQKLAELRKDSLKFLLDSLKVKKAPYKIENFDEKLICPTNISYGECYGCYACEAICPKNAISMFTDSEGFTYPIVNEQKCVHCGLCEKVCIRNKPNHVEYEKKFPKVLAAINQDEETRMGSSSGGVFPALAKHFIEDLKGAVVGVKWNEDMVAVADVAETMEDVKAFYGSKYVKSDYRGIKERVKKLLDEGRYVLYTGLPCECASLRAYLKKDYEKLLICEILCHSAPSPKVLKKYVEYLEKKFQSKVVDIAFRNKEKGWLGHENIMAIALANGEVIKVNARKNNYYRSFTKDNMCRVSCTKCAFTKLNRAGDITLGDFWGIKDIIPEMFDDKGASLVLLNNAHGETYWNAVKTQFSTKESNVKDAFKKNHSKPSPYKTEREEIFGRFEEEDIDMLLEEFNDLKQKDKK